MTRQEFMDGLKRALTNSLSPNEVAEYLVYYQDYIDSQMRNGVPESEVMEALGDPRLIARSIRTAKAVESESSSTYNKEETYDEENENAGQAKWGNDYRRVYTGMPAWLIMVIIGVVFVLIISFVASVVSFLLPVLLPVLCILLIVQIFKRT